MLIPNDAGTKEMRKRLITPSSIVHNYHCYAGDLLNWNSGFIPNFNHERAFVVLDSISDLECSHAQNGLQFPAQAKSSDSFLLEPTQLVLIIFGVIVFPKQGKHSIERFLSLKLKIECPQTL